MYSYNPNTGEITMPVMLGTSSDTVGCIERYEAALARSEKAGRARAAADGSDEEAGAVRLAYEAEEAAADAAAELAQSIWQWNRPDKSGFPAAKCRGVIYVVAWRHGRDTVYRVPVGGMVDLD